MAARYLLIEFDDEATASVLRAQIDNATRKGKGFRVVGLFAKPTRFCRCGTWTTSRGTNSTLQRGEKFGWSVCTVCKRPAPLMSQLKNLLKPSDIIMPLEYEVADDLTKKTQQMGFYTHALSAVSLGIKSFK